jgi:hypothetical protein
LTLASDQAAKPIPRLFAISIHQFNEIFSADVISMPQDVAAVGWVPEKNAWCCAPARIARDTTFRQRAPSTLRFLSEWVLPKGKGACFWTLYCAYDGWREYIPFDTNFHWVEQEELGDLARWDGPPGSVPSICRTRRQVACHCAHQGDPSAIVLPEAHFLTRNFYAGLFRKVDHNDCPWPRKRPEAILCAGNHGSAFNYFSPPVQGRTHPRNYLRQRVVGSGLPLHIHLDKGVSHREQLAFKYLLDVDGLVRTWDAFAWKMYSGSTLLLADSPWDSFFTRQFEPWTHYIPIANDFHDIEEKIDWCRSNDDACRDIAERGRQHALQVYDPATVAELTARELGIH